MRTRHASAAAGNEALMYLADTSMGYVLRLHFLDTEAKKSTKVTTPGTKILLIF